MCLTKDFNLTEKTRKREKPFFAYKVVRRLSGKKICFRSPFNHLEWDENGLYRAKGFQNWQSGDLHGGAIHAWRTLKAARDFRNTRSPRDNYFILKVKIYPEHFIAAGIREDVAATQVYLTRDELRKVRKQARKKKYIYIF